LFQVVEHAYQVAQAAAKPVEFPDNKRIAALEFLEATQEGRAVADGSRKAVIPEHFSATGSFERGKL
jgi:hypothetical protein